MFAHMSEIERDFTHFAKEYADDDVAAQLLAHIGGSVNLFAPKTVIVSEVY